MPCCIKEQSNTMLKLLDRSLMIGWRKSSWNSERVSSVFTFLSVSIYGLQSTSFDLGTNFWIEWSLEHEKENQFFFSFRNFHFYAFIWHFLYFFAYITLVNFSFHATGHSFSPRNVIFGLREPCTVRNWSLKIFWGNFSFELWWFLGCPCHA